MKQEMSRNTRWLLVLAGGVVMGAAFGIRNIQGLYLLPVTLDRGWSREAFSFALAMQNLAWGFAQPLTGMIADRRPGRHVLAARSSDAAIAWNLVARDLRCLVRAAWRGVPPPWRGCRRPPCCTSAGRGSCCDRRT